MSNLNQTNVTLSGRRQGGKSHLVDKNATIHQNIFSHTKLLLEILFFFSYFICNTTYLGILQKFLGNQSSLEGNDVL